ncbi:MAG: NirA family protein, partial [Armatimonadota bacterium]|nr:NirA family protein [Armatimonadota bacterium]
MNIQEEFTEEQKQYLQGFISGSNVARAALGMPGLSMAVPSVEPVATPPAPAQVTNGAANGAMTNGTAKVVEKPAEPMPVGPEAIHRQAQDRFLAEGKKLTNEEKAKREKHPFDIWDTMREHADEGRFPKGTDVFLWKFHGLFYAAPNQESYMCRLRFPNGIVNSHQMRRMADLAERYAGGYAHVTTRANIQLREIGAHDSLAVLTELHEAGIINRGAGADNIRNITGSPTAGIDQQELIDTRPLARELHHTILNHKELYGLPRKFNIGFDGGGTISVLEDTNDIGFTAVRVGEGHEV